MEQLCLVCGCRPISGAYRRTSENDIFKYVKTKFVKSCLRFFKCIKYLYIFLTEKQSSYRISRNAVQIEHSSVRGCICIWNKILTASNRARASADTKLNVHQKQAEFNFQYMRYSFYPKPKTPKSSTLHRPTRLLYTSSSQQHVECMPVHELTHWRFS